MVREFRATLHFALIKQVIAWKKGEFDVAPYLLDEMTHYTNHHRWIDQSRSKNLRYYYICYYICIYIITIKGGILPPELKYLVA